MCIRDSIGPVWRGHDQGRHSARAKCGDETGLYRAVVLADDERHVVGVAADRDRHREAHPIARAKLEALPDAGTAGTVAARSGTTRTSTDDFDRAVPAEIGDVPSKRQ